MQRRRRAIFTTAHPRDVIDQTEKLAGKIEWGYVDKGLRHEDTENPRRVFISRQQSGMLGVIKRTVTSLCDRASDRPPRLAARRPCRQRHPIGRRMQGVSAYGSLRVLLPIPVSLRTPRTYRSATPDYVNPKQPHILVAVPFYSVSAQAVPKSHANGPR